MPTPCSRSPPAPSRLIARAGSGAWTIVGRGQRPARERAPGRLQVRLDVGLFTSDSAKPLARASVTAPPDSIEALTNGVIKALLPSDLAGRDGALAEP